MFIFSQHWAYHGDVVIVSRSMHFENGQLREKVVFFSVVLLQLSLRNNGIPPLLISILRRKRLFQSNCHASKDSIYTDLSWATIWSATSYQIALSLFSQFGHYQQNIRGDILLFENMRLKTSLNRTQIAFRILNKFFLRECHQIQCRPKFSISLKQT